MSLYKAGETWGIDYRDEYGRRHRKAVGSQEAAATLEARMREETNRRKASVSHYTLGEGITIEAAADIWLATIPVGARRRDHIRRTIRTAATRLGNIAAARVTPKLLAEYAESRKPELAPTSQAKENGTLRQLFGWLAEQWYLPSNPAAALPTHCPRRSAGTSISYHEEAQLIEACRTHNTQLKLLLAIDAGLRVSEITALRTEHWNPDGQTLTVYSTKTRTTRTIPATRRLAAAIQAGPQMPGATLTRSAGQPHSATSFLRKSKRAGTAIRFHDLRHSFASRIAAVSKPHVVRTLLGHSPRTTTDLYTHPSPDELRAAIDAMEAANPNATQPTTRKEPDTMPGKRFAYRIRGMQYGFIHDRRARPAKEQSNAQPGTVIVEVADDEHHYVVDLRDLEPIPQSTTKPNPDAEPGEETEEL